MSTKLTLLFVLLGLLGHLSQGQQDYIDAHNAARSEVGVGSISWDGTVAAYAQNYANQRAGDCNMVHSQGPYGENIAWGSGGLSGTDAVNMWVDEKQFYDHGANTCAAGKVCGHYTQVVWRNSVRLGCGSAACNSGGTFVVCSYDPPGNYNGESPY
ncbi:hypothetical protein Sjap_022592 [Stephania japonica]|uniref:SCP domain-containing protein n=1 Tax=Stephania japonica TaxID=461633 RepID=A0AAP0HV44_9MAGN